MGKKEKKKNQSYAPQRINYYLSGTFTNNLYKQLFLQGDEEGYSVFQPSSESSLTHTTQNLQGVSVILYL